MGVSVANGTIATLAAIISGATTGIPTPTASQTVIQKTQVNSGAQTNVYTVTTGKTLYIHGVLFKNNNAGYSTDSLDNNAGTVILNCNIPPTSSMLMTGGVLAVYTSGQVVKYTCGRGADGTINIWGVEQWV